LKKDKKRNVTRNSTPLQPLNSDSPGTLSSAVDGVPSNPGSKKRPSDSTAENSHKKIKTGEENLNQSDDSASNSIVVHCGDDSNSAEDQGLNAGEERPLPPVSTSPITAKERWSTLQEGFICT
jgi:hypothetical protein